MSQVDSREDVSDLLTLEGKIDLVIPRGSQELVCSVRTLANGKIPVLGHTEGVCHVYVDQHADMEKALRIGEWTFINKLDSHVRSLSLCLSVCPVVDSKCSYPAACNAMETLLVHSSHLNTAALHNLTSALKSNDVS